MQLLATGNKEISTKNPRNKQQLPASVASRAIQDRTGMSLRRVIQTRRPLRSATITIDGTAQTVDPEIGLIEQTIINQLQRH